MSASSSLRPTTNGASFGAFESRLAARSRRMRSLVCAGVDASPDAVALLSATSRLSPAARIERFSGMVIESVRDVAVAVKFQLAWFERLGADGIRALERSVAYARSADLIVVIDAKRGDVPHSARAYADAWLGSDAPSGCGGDALTVHATVGDDALQAMADVAHDRGCQLFALVHTSNPGATELQAAFWRELAVMARDARVGAVIGATQPAILNEARTLLAGAPLLIPGIGAQGGTVADLAALAADEPASPPPLISASRSLLPTEPCDTNAFRFHVARSARDLAVSLEPIMHLR